MLTIGFGEHMASAGGGIAGVELGAAAAAAPSLGRRLVLRIQALAIDVKLPIHNGLPFSLLKVATVDDLVVHDRCVRWSPLCVVQYLGFRQM
jgi:hypothetical protein